MQIDLKPYRALVCGSTQGIGLAIANGFLAAGAHVTLFARDAEKLAKVAAELAQKHKGAGIATLSADFNEPEQVVAALQEALGEQPVFDILVNNSGGPPGGPLLDASPEEFTTSLHRHLFVNHRLAQLLAPGMKARGSGRIINVVSTSVYEPIAGLGVSNTTRASVAGWAKTLAKELAASGITVNNILPGATNTQRLVSIIEKRAEASGKPKSEIEAHMKAEIPAGRFALPEEIAALAVFLASPQAAYITGTSIPVDGGRMNSI